MPWECVDERHAYEKCQYDEYVIALVSLHLSLISLHLSLIAYARMRLVFVLISCYLVFDHPTNMTHDQAAPSLIMSTTSCCRFFSIRYMKRMRKAQKAKLEADEAHH
jgi:hypothetical protein